MTVSCRVKCPYNVQGFCARGLTAIDENGMCSVWWKNGQRYQNRELEGTIYKEPINIITLAKAKKVEDGLQHGDGVDSVSKPDNGVNEGNSADSESSGDNIGGTRGTEAESGQDGTDDKESS